MIAVLELMCEWCGARFARPHTKGPVPLYCKRSHRQRAYEQRRLDRDSRDSWMAGLCHAQAEAFAGTCEQQGRRFDGSVPLDEAARASAP